MSRGDRGHGSNRPVDLPRLREALARLDGIALAHPELLGPPSAANVAGWRAFLRESEREGTERPDHGTRDFVSSHEGLATVAEPLPNGCEEQAPQLKTEQGEPWQ